MDTDNLLSYLQDWPMLAAGGAAAVAVLVLLAVLLRRKARPKLSRRVTALATVLGLAWSAQGMWDVATTEYGMSSVVASVVFIVFEAMAVARMLKAHEYRTDFARRSKHIRAVWLIASAMALVVAFGEGWQQAPARLAIPLLVAYGWYTDLTSDDDPKDVPRTTVRWTLRRAALAVGAIEAGEKDLQTVDRDRLRTRMTRLAFKIEYGDTKVSEMLNRSVRLARLKTLADDEDLAEVRARLARTRSVLFDQKPEPDSKPEETHPVLPPQPNPPEEVRPGKPADPPSIPDRQGMHARDGRILRGPELKADAMLLMQASMAADRPRGMTVAELAGHYVPPLKTRTAESFAAEARKRINGHALTG